MYNLGSQLLNVNESVGIGNKIVNRIPFLTIWIVDIDLEKFFDNVPQDKLMSYVGRVIHDGDTESLIRKYLKAGVMNQGRYEPTDVGTPQGGNLSLLLSNIMLNELDYELDQRHLNFVLYADDVITVL